MIAEQFCQMINGLIISGLDDRRKYLSVHESIYYWDGAETSKNQQLPTRVTAENVKRENLGESTVFRDAILSHKQKRN